MAIRSAAAISAAVLLTWAVVWTLTQRSISGLEEERRRRVLDLVTALSAAASPDQAPRLKSDILDAPTERALRSHVTDFRSVTPEIRSVYLATRDPSTGDWRVLVASSAGEPPGRAEGGRLEPPEGVSLAKAMLGASVSPRPARRPDGAWTIAGLAPVRDATGAVVALAGADMDATALLRSQQGVGRDGLMVSLALAAGIVVVGAVHFRRRHAQLERMRGLEAQISIYRVGEILARAEREEDLVRYALDAIAEGSGIAHWAIYLRAPARDDLLLFATRGLPEEARPELAPDPVARDARSPASRAAWHRETLIGRDESAARDYAFPARTPGLGPLPAVVSMPLTDRGEVMAVLQCFVPRHQPVETEDLALIRWMASQVSVGLKRIRMERRDQMLASYMMGTGEILLGLDSAGAITHANAAAERALGVGPGGLVGRELGAVALPEGAAQAGSGAFGTSLLRLAREGGEFAGEIWFLRASGTRFPAEVRLSPTRSGDGVLTGMVLVGHDVTERREREAEITNRTQELALMNEELQRANAELEEARRMQNEFVANTSHELRTPLNAVIGFATLVEQGAHESEQEAREFAAQIRRSAEHLLGLLNDILDLAKVEAGRFQLTMSLGDLRPAIQAAVDTVSPMALGRGLNLLVDLPLEPLEALLDTSRLRQVMMNLLGNAVKFTDEGDVRVCARRDTLTGEAKLIVEDTGIGIPKERQTDLFSKFTQVDGSYTRRHRGTGLGLAISKALIQNMGGTITVESEGLGRGTRATVTLPAPRAGARRAASGESVSRRTAAGA
jgi:PAS domain S-box-containing protein